MRKTVFSLILILLIINTYNFPPIYGYNPNYTYLIVYEDGSVTILQEYYIKSPPEDILVKLLGPPIYIEATSGGVLMSINITDDIAYITATNTTLKLEYIVINLTSKIGDEWLISYTYNYSSTVILPENAMIIEIKPDNFEVTLVNNSIALIMKPGEVNIRYILIPTTSAEPPKNPPQPPYFNSILIYVIIGIIIFFIASFLILKLTKRKRYTRIYEELDNRDKKILNVLSKYGELTAKELIEKTDIPKTPLYRRLKRLVNSGYIESITRSGITYYRLRLRK